MKLRLQGVQYVCELRQPLAESKIKGDYPSLPRGVVPFNSAFGFSGKGLTLAITRGIDPLNTNTQWPVTIPIMIDGKDF